ncbi:hypothetical protein P261_00870 [Lachnospiraceae bacterium TWA4]|nr:hypothetical protein P261_00870 [Lachnospiraceae bacterium TWA4]
MFKNKNNEIHNKNKLHNERIFILIVCVIAAIFFGVNWYRGQAIDGEVVITVDGQEYRRLSLKQNETIVIEGVNKGTNTVTIEDGKVFMEDASCPDHVCMKMGKVSTVGAPITCLPNKVVVVIQKSQDKIDAVVQ